VFTGAVAPDFSNQVRDFDPGIRKSGLFWTIALSSDAVSVNLDKGKAHYHADNVELEDYFNIPNALSDGQITGPPVAATVSFDVHWKNPTDHYNIKESTQGFRGSFWVTDATITWSGQNDNGDAFQSTAVTAVNFAAIGHERNGKFA